MKVTFYSNFMNHHQLPFSLIMHRQLGSSYHFVACTPIESERLAMGYEDMNRSYDFIVRPYENKEHEVFARQLAVESDVIIFGSGDTSYLQQRMERNKLTFYYTERLFKKGTFRRFIPITYRKVKNRWLQYQDKNFYVLCSSAYTSYDLSLCGFPAEKCFKWAYFPECKICDCDKLMRKKNTRQLLWAGRFLDWKHPEAAVEVAAALKKDKIPFHLNMIGDGRYKQKIDALIKARNLSQDISLLGSMPPELVRSNMENSSVFLFTSDFREGWGAVLNEAMNSGCAVVASHAAGAAPFLIEDGGNGFIYPSGNSAELYRKVKLLMNDPMGREEMGRNAYETIKNVWNAQNAAACFLQLCEGIMENKEIRWKDGPCSQAEVLSNAWYTGVK